MTNPDLMTPIEAIEDLIKVNQEKIERAKHDVECLTAENRGLRQALEFVTGKVKRGRPY